jgi:Cdc6-like AAA superfamily ATPase
MVKNDITNFYDVLPDQFKTKYHIANYKQHKINVPFRMLIVGASGSGKTTVLLELMKRMSGTFETIIICAKSLSEPYYLWLQDKYEDNPNFMFFEGLDAIPNLNNLNGAGQTLIVFDDLVIEKNQKIIEDFFIRGRKIAGGISCCYLTQSFYKTPKIIRLQCNYVIIKKLSSTKDLNLILSEYSLGLTKDQLMSMYKEAVSEKNSFLLIDMDSMGSFDPNIARLGFRKNFLQNLQPENI